MPEEKGRVGRGGLKRIQSNKGPRQMNGAVVSKGNAWGPGSNVESWFRARDGEGLREKHAEKRENYRRKKMSTKDGPKRGKDRFSPRPTGSTWWMPKNGGVNVFRKGEQEGWNPPER